MKSLVVKLDSYDKEILNLSLSMLGPELSKLAQKFAARGADKVGDLLMAYPFLYKVDTRDASLYQALSVTLRNWGMTEELFRKALITQLSAKDVKEQTPVYWEVNLTPKTIEFQDYLEKVKKGYLQCSKYSDTKLLETWVSTVEEWFNR